MLSLISCLHFVDWTGVKPANILLQQLQKVFSVASSTVFFFIRFWYIKVLRLSLKPG